LALRRKIATAAPRRFTEDDLAAARDAGLLPEATHHALVAFLSKRQDDERQDDERQDDERQDDEAKNRVETSPRPAPVRFDLTHVLWYAGALVVMLAMGVFTTEAFNRMGGAALTATAIVYGTGLLALCHYLWHVRDLRTPAGLAAAVAVAMVPMGIYGIQDMQGLWPGSEAEPGRYRDFFPWINSSWIYMELGTIAAAALVLCFYPFPFITFVAAVALWFLSIDVAGWFTPDRVADLELRRNVSLWFGLALVLVAWIIDLASRSRGDFAFWLHLAGAAAFWGGLSWRESSSEWLALVYCAINIGLILFSVLADRRVYAVFGALGIAIYLGHLVYDVFPDVLWFSFALSGIGLLIIGLGVLYERKRDALAGFLEARLFELLHARREGPEPPPRA
jgi:hypothetical protein